MSTARRIDSLLHATAIGRLDRSTTEFNVEVTHRQVPSTCRMQLLAHIPNLASSEVPDIHCRRFIVEETRLVTLESSS
jgi:hypothetical protein